MTQFVAARVLYAIEEVHLMPRGGLGMALAPPNVAHRGCAMFCAGTAEAGIAGGRHPEGLAFAGPRIHPRIGLRIGPRQAMPAEPSTP